MCKFCEKQIVKKNIYKVNQRGRGYTVQEDAAVNPSWDNAEWTTDKYIGQGRDNGGSMDVSLNLDTKEIEFVYNAYSSDSSFSDYLHIRYCPFCGRKL